VCFTIAGWTHYKLLQDAFRGKLDTSIVERFTAIRDVHSELGLSAVIDIIDGANGDSSVPMQATTGYVLLTADGQPLASNLTTSQITLGWSSIAGEQIGLAPDTSYRFFTGNLGDNTLAIGRSMDGLKQLKDSALKSFFWTFLITTILAVLGAIAMAYRAHLRIDQLASAMDRVAAGQLSARMPVSDRGDDIDDLSVQINDALNRLQSMVDGMRQVSNDIAHDLKTPLNRLYIQIEEAAMKVRDGKSEQAEDDLYVAMEEAQNINATFEALLRIAQIEAGARRANFLMIHMNTILETAYEVYQAVVEENGQQLVLTPNAQRVLPMFGDQELILQLIVNLLENAIRHTPEGTVITIDAGETDDSVWLSIGDNGPGIPAESREKVFQRLYRLEASRTTQGTGLGLSLVKAVADLHCGEIRIDDNNPGCRIQVTFDLHCPIDSVNSI